MLLYKENFKLMIIMSTEIFTLAVLGTAHVQRVLRPGTIASTEMVIETKSSF